MSMTKKLENGKIIEMYTYRSTPDQAIVTCSLIYSKEEMEEFIKELNERSECDLLLQEFEHNFSVDKTTLFLQKRRRK